VVTVTAAANDFGRGVLTAVERGDRLAARAVASDRLDAGAARLGLQVTLGVADPTRRLGPALALAGVSEAFRTGGVLPFFITWPVPTGLPPAAMPAAHQVQPDTITLPELLGDLGAIDGWLGSHDLPVTTRASASSLAAVNIRTRAGTIRIS
jgi:hypothetical protein